MEAGANAFDPRLFLEVYLSSSIAHIPDALIGLAGMVLALVWRKRHPAVSLLAGLACGLLLLCALAWPAWVAFWITGHARASDVTSGQGYTLSVLVLTVFRATYLGLLLVAVFAGRRPAAHFAPPLTGPVSRSASEDETVQLEAPPAPPVERSEHVRRAEDGFRP
jgi:hypothetical protein